MNRLTQFPIKPIPIGKVLYSPNKKINIKNIIFSEIEVEAPTRLNALVFDLNRMHPTNIAFTQSGSLSFGCDVKTKVRIKILNNKNTLKIKGNGRKSIVKHTILVCKKLFDLDFGLEVNFEEIPHHHLGLGSSAALQSAIFIGINYMLGNPFKEKELIKLIAGNHIEEISENKNKVLPGFSIGAGAAVALKGGVVVIIGQANLLYRTILPEDYYIYIGIPNAITKIKSHLNEEAILLNIGQDIDKIIRYGTAYDVLHSLLPALMENNFKKIGEIVWKYQLISGKGVVNLIHKGMYRYFELMQRIKDIADVVFVSSVGPGLVIIANKAKSSNVEEILEINNWFFIKTYPNNRGANIRNLK